MRLGGDERDWVLPRVLEEQAKRQPDQTFVQIVDGGTFTYGALADAAGRVAGFLEAQGIGKGDHVAVMLPNGLDFLAAWAGIGRLGAIMVALNTELVGAFLAHQLADCGARCLIADPLLASAIEAVDPAGTAPILVSEDVAAVGRRRSFDAWRDAEPYGGAMPAHSDIACIMYTSGTTGPAKGVLLPHAHCFLFGLGTIDNLALTSQDNYYVTLPLFHANGLFMQVGACLIAGIAATVRPRFSASNWLSDIKRSGATVTNMLGATSAFIAAQPPREGERDHRLRAIAAAPNHPAHESMWRERFGVSDVIGLYGMTEVNIPLYGRLGEARPGTCGRVYERYFEVSIRDPDDDRALAPGEAGEIMVRPRAAFGFMAGYLNRPDQTLAAWRNLWFHTGDAGVADADGTITFLDRIKDCIRRRGENISSTEIESAVTRLSGVRDAAAFAVPSDIPGGEDEVMVAVLAADGVTLEPAAIADHARRHLPRFAWPRFVEIMEEFPRTSTGKVRKQELRSRGVTAESWDAERTADGCSATPRSRAGI